LQGDLFMNLKLIPAILAIACCAMTSWASEASSSEAAAVPQANWSAWGGTVGVRLEQSNLRGMGITARTPAGHLPEGSPRLTDGLNVMRAYDIDLFALRESGSIEFKASRGSFDGFLGGSPRWLPTGFAGRQHDSPGRLPPASERVQSNAA
jgi:hypothetical protein